ncbi:MAG: chemotaxis protein CheA [Planctomycetaceae bacterium]|nr:chemotaxis protein CheA [Planctomycetaceae bacterium]
MSNHTIDSIDLAVLKLMEVDDFHTPEADELASILTELSNSLNTEETPAAVEAVQRCVHSLKHGPEEKMAFGQVIQAISQTLTNLQDIKQHGKSSVSTTFPQKPAAETAQPTPSMDCDVCEPVTEQDFMQPAPVNSGSDNSIDYIDQAVLKLMEVDTFDSPETDELTDILNDLLGTLKKGSSPEAIGAVERCLHNLRHGPEEGYSFGQVIQTTSQTLSCLQDVKLHGKSYNEIQFPELTADEVETDQTSIQESAGYAEAMALAEVLNTTDPGAHAPSRREDAQQDVLFNGDPDMLGLFIEDATEHLEHVEADLLTLEQNPHNPEALDSAFRSFHSVKGSAGFAQLVPIEKIAHAMEEMLDMARDGKLTLQNQAMDLTLATLDCIRMWVRRVQTSLDEGTPLIFTSEGKEYITQIRAIVSGEVDLKSLSVPKQTSTAVVEEETTSSGSSVSAGSSVETESSSQASRSEAVRVDRHRLDELIDLIGELVITESMVTAEVHQLQNHHQDTTTCSQLRKITRELQELSLSLRMMPIHGLFQKAKRVVRDLSRKLNKPAELVIEGAETELDKSILDELSDPIVHLIRNSVDHGIEATPEDRVKAGKPRTAEITVRAFHKGGNIYVEIEDDGRGLNREKLVSRAIERGIINPNQELTNDEIHQLIFAPGFSTAEQVTEVSGRGVGMDVVRRNIEALRGSVHVTSTPGVGTIISLRLPLTLAIIDGMVVRVADQRYIIPTLSIVHQMHPQQEMLSTVHGRGEMVAVRGQNVPFHRLAQVFGLSKEKKPTCESTIILIEEKDRLAGLLVDEVIGQQQVVIKSLGTTLSEVSVGIAGAAVMPDGEIGLILDVHSVLELARGSRNLK